MAVLFHKQAKVPFVLILAVASFGPGNFYHAVFLAKCFDDVWVSYAYLGDID